MAAQNVERSAGGGIPNPHCAIVATTGQAFAVRIPCCAPDAALMPRQRVYHCAEFRVPNLHRKVITRAGQALAVRAPRHTPHCAGMSLQQMQQFVQYYFLEY